MWLILFKTVFEYVLKIKRKLFTVTLLVVSRSASQLLILQVCKLFAVGSIGLIGSFFVLGICYASSF